MILCPVCRDACAVVGHGPTVDYWVCECLFSYFEFDDHGVVTGLACGALEFSANISHLPLDEDAFRHIVAVATVHGVMDS